MHFKGLEEKKSSTGRDCISTVIRLHRQAKRLGLLSDKLSRFLEVKTGFSHIFIEPSTAANVGIQTQMKGISQLHHID